MAGGPVRLPPGEGATPGPGPRASATARRPDWSRLASAEEQVAQGRGGGEGGGGGGGGGQREGEGLAGAELLLRVRREMPVDDGFGVQSVEQGLDQGQRAGVDDLRGGRGAAPGKGHHGDPPRRKQRHKGGPSRRSGARCTFMIRRVSNAAASGKLTRTRPGPPRPSL